MDTHKTNVEWASGEGVVALQQPVLIDTFSYFPLKTLFRITCSVLFETWFLREQNRIEQNHHGSHTHPSIHRSIHRSIKHKPEIIIFVKVTNSAACLLETCKRRPNRLCIYMENICCQYDKESVSGKVGSFIHSSVHAVRSFTHSVMYVLFSSCIFLCLFLFFAFRGYV